MYDFKCVLCFFLSRLMIHLKLFIKSCGQFTRTGYFDPDSHRAVWDTTPATLAVTTAPLLFTQFYLWAYSFVLLITLLDFMFTAYFCNIFT